VPVEEEEEDHSKGYFVPALLFSLHFHSVYLMPQSKTNRFSPKF
jgi:hypothetical protein